VGCKRAAIRRQPGRLKFRQGLKTQKPLIIEDKGLIDEGVGGYLLSRL
jgi:hypothetical protein